MALASMSALEPIQVAFGLRHLRRKMQAEMESATGSDLCDLARAYVSVIDPLLRICQVPTPPRASLPRNGDNAKPVLALD